MGITSTKTSVNPLYAEKLKGSSIPPVGLHVFSNGSWSQVHASWQLVIPVTGVYRIDCGASLQWEDTNADGQAYGFVRLARNGTGLDGTSRHLHYYDIGGGANGGGSVQTHYIGTFNAGDIIALQGYRVSDTMYIYQKSYSTPLEENLLTYELLEEVVPVNQVSPSMPFYDTGWIACSDWTDQHLGTAVGSNVVHNLGYNLRELLVQVFISTDGTDTNSIEVKTVDSSPGAQLGITLFNVNTNQITVQTGAGGIRYLLNTAGTATDITTQSYYYRIVVTKLQPVLSARDISGDYSTSETDTGRQWIDGKTIYRKCFSGTSAAASSSSIASGVSPDNVIKLEYIQKTAINTILFAGSEFTSGGVDTVWATYRTSTHASPNTIFLQHNEANAQSQPYFIIMEYTK